MLLALPIPAPPLPSQIFEEQKTPRETPSFPALARLGYPVCKPTDLPNFLSPCALQLSSRAPE